MRVRAVSFGFGVSTAGLSRKAPGLLLLVILYESRDLFSPIEVSILHCNAKTMIKDKRPKELSPRQWPQVRPDEVFPDRGEDNPPLFVATHAKKRRSHQRLFKRCR